MSRNPDRDNKKIRLLRELHRIKVEELGESALERDSFYRGLVSYTPADEKFWQGLPRYMFDCLSDPKVMPDSQTTEWIKDSIDKAREIYQANPERY